MASAAMAAPHGPAWEAKAAIERFLEGSRQPILLEPGEPALPMEPGRYTLRPHGQHLIVEAWTEEVFLSRRIKGIRSEREGRVELEIQRLGGRPGHILLFDGARHNNLPLHGKGRRLVFGEQFRLFLGREFSGWRLVNLSTEANLEDSLSPAYPRAFLRRGRHGIAAMAAPASGDIDGVLSFGLIWLDYLRRREPETAIQSLAVFLPSGHANPTCWRIRHLDPKLAEYHVFAYTEEGRTARLDPLDCGNLATELLPPGAERPARWQPEALLEQQLRGQLPLLDARLEPTPVYGQVSAFAGGGRGILDLLAVDYQGRLTVIELKASESVHLPLQALDYWMRVGWHLERGDFTRLGYFPGRQLSTRPPRLMLAAPALCFHPTNERIVRFLQPSIEVDRIGLAHDWAHPRVLFRYSRENAG
ncbi:MAG: hypothetical protein HYR59_04560 [Acidobacteria bacterium]|nr:hypothetical protein [Acidobacteriota bacterium]